MRFAKRAFSRGLILLRPISLRKISLGLSLLTLGLLPSCVSPLDIQTYTRIELKNMMSVVRPNEVVEIPLTVVRERYPAFSEQDFSVHLLNQGLYEKGDPMLALAPPQEIAAQLSDQDLDGKYDTLLVSLDFGAGESRVIAVASPRYSLLADVPTSAVHTGLWRREVLRTDGDQVLGEGGLVLATSDVYTPGGVTGEEIYFMAGPIFESDLIAYRFSFDRRLAMDVIGKRRPGLVLASVASEGSLGSGSWGGSLLGDPAAFGAGSLGVSLAEGVEPLQSFNSVQYRQVSDGPVAAESEIILTGCQMGENAFDVKWRITAYRGSRHLRHSASVNRVGHNLAFALQTGGARTREFSSARTGWMRKLSYGRENVLTGESGSLGLGLMFLGRQSTGYTEGPPEIMGVRFDPMLKEFQWYVAAAWDGEESGLNSIDEFQIYLEKLAVRVNNPIRVRNLDYIGA